MDRERGERFGVIGGFVMNINLRKSSNRKEERLASKADCMGKAGRAVRRKLKSQDGESIAEVLITALVVALGALLLVAMVVAARNIIQKSERTYNTYLNGRNTEEALDNSDHNGDNSPVESGVAFTLDDQSGSTLVLNITAVTDGTTANAVALPQSGIVLSETGSDPLTFHVVEENGEMKFVTYEPKSGTDSGS